MPPENSVQKEEPRSLMRKKLSMPEASLPSL